MEPPPSDAPVPQWQGLGASYLDFLSDDTCPSLFMDLLDPQTLQAVCNQNMDVLGPPPVPPSEDTRRKLQEQDSDAGSDAEEQGSGSKGGVGGGTGGGSVSNNRKAARSEANQAAKNKATREKARREKINDRFSELAQLIDPGKDPKTDKPSILQDAIKCVQQMRMENHQLRQLNKFLEERMGQLERERGQNLYQQSLMMQQGGGMMGLPGMPGPSSMPPFHPPQPSTSASTSAQVAAAAAAMAAASGGPHPSGASTSSAPFPSMRLPPQAAASTSGRQPASHGTNLPGGSFAAAAAAAAAAIQAGAGEKRAGTPLGGVSKSARVSPKLPPMQSGAVGGGGTGVGVQGGSSIHADAQGGGALGDACAQPHQVAGAPGLSSPQQQGEAGIAPDLEDPGLPGPLHMPAVSFPPSAVKLGQSGLPMGPGVPWFPGVSEAGVGTSMGMGLGGDPLFGGNWVKPEMLDSMQDSLLRPPAA
uniref:BHLH domain-containing protein n=1 Tax=Dunaliella tertiolecta TaxID=3047 RepID=A0A7S3VUV6_DUNTE|mmetsp:Transcript_14130/g.38220  ORF Transcript_14130/g.38220 Transcript_14130/m.38220 type:complete len:475 (+) Transcript_14130:173-1597(+)|eukprot:CAMPEP_0202340692 /NCGR_PEP_ID=MMETSP1126-20121109/2019_1 /ASSEMBLY_ACC=CAM_ASM_000457 /TAXON_ID=3047 /ORGANISM="Dunaliella tertiolecta, Strain CCMP1320" /LENGTH=474 /DNA_ID=CAMNT_0048931427 /DNA_START=140 /DNA_END=1564 /DNA_ORIENTATION=+